MCPGEGGDGFFFELKARKKGLGLESLKFLSIPILVSMFLSCYMDVNSSSFTDMSLAKKANIISYICIVENLGEGRFFLYTIKVLVFFHLLLSLNYFNKH